MCAISADFLMSRIFIAALLLVLSTGALAAKAIDTGPVLVITRHAEKQAGDDPCLTDTGKARAERLSKLLGNMPIKALLSTDYCRTRETLAVLAQQSGLAVETYEPLDSAAIQARLFDGDNGAVVVSGHSNTIPALLARLGVKIPEISESEYGNLYILTLNREKTAGSLVRLTY